MGEIIGQTDIKREKDYLYYVSFDKEGFLQIGKAKLARQGRFSKAKKEVDEQ